MTVTQIDWDIIDARVKAERVDGSYKNDSFAFLSLVLKQLFPSIDDELVECITDGGDDRGVDAIHIVEAEDHAEIFLFQAKYRDSLKTTSRTINDSEILKLSLFLRQLFDRAAELERCGNFRLKQSIQRIWDLHAGGKYCRYTVMLCSNGMGMSSTAKVIADSICADLQQVNFEYFGPRDYIRSVASEGRFKEDGKLQVIGKEILERIDGDVRGIIASIEARSFIDMIQTYDGNSIKRHIFDDNLRIFLGSKGGYNNEIISTATSNDSYLFWYLNNGITITCRNFHYNKGHANPQLTIEDFQIVNGAQTSHSLFEASKINAEALNDVVLMVRVYATDRTDIAERVAVATNSQAKIQSRDLRANSDVLKKLELAFREHGYFFERKKGMHSEQPDEKRLDALKLGQIIFSFILREPERARSESDAIFGSQFGSIFHDRYDIDELCRLVELYRIIERLREEYTVSFGSAPETGDQHQYLVYGHWFVLFACRLLLAKAGTAKAPVGKDAELLVEDAIRLVANACSQQKAVAHYQMFRSPKTRDKIYAEMSGKQGDLFDHFALS